MYTLVNVRHLSVGSIILACLVAVLLFAAIIGVVAAARKKKHNPSSASKKERFSLHSLVPPDPLPVEARGVTGRGRAGLHTSMLDPAFATSTNTTTNAANKRPAEFIEVYADNNATTPLFQEVIEVLVQSYVNFYANASSIHAAGKKSSEALENSREVIASLIGARPEEMYFTSGATESNNLAIRGLMRVALSPAFSSFLNNNETDNNEDELSLSRLQRVLKRDREHRQNKKGVKHKIVTTPIEHASVYETAATIDPEIEILHVNVDRKGKIDLAHFTELVDDPEVAMACIIMANNEIGTIQDVHRLSKICKKKGVHFHCDMTQVFGKYIVDLKSLGPDSATMSAHKFHGPKGVGALYVKQGAWIDNTCMTGGSQEGALRAGTENVSGVCGMAAALQKCHALIAVGRDNEVRQMRDKIRRTLLSKIPGMLVNGDSESGMYNTLSICLPDVNSRKLIPMLDEHGVYVNTGCACSKGQGSATLKALGLSEKYINGSLRISLGFMTTEEECEHLCKVMLDALSRMQTNKAS